MPFTFSHPAIVLPLIGLRQKWRSSTGLIIGSMAPDFEKFLRMDLHDPYSHTWRSIFYFNLPISILVCFLFHLVVRDPLIDHLPNFLRQRFDRFKSFNWVAQFKQHYFIIFLSLFVGIISHLAWDSFTHKEGLGVRLFPFLQQSVLPNPFTRPYFALLQQILSLVGGFIMVAFILLLPKADKVLPKKNIFAFWTISFIIVVLVVTFWILAGGKLNRYYLIVAAISAGLLSIILLSVFIKCKSLFFSKAVKHH